MLENVKDFKQYRKKAYFSCKKYTEGKGYRFDEHLFEDSFQDSCIKYLTNRTYCDDWLKSKGREGEPLPLSAILNRMTREYYFSTSNARWLNNDSVEGLLDAIEGSDTSVSTKASSAYYRLSYHEKRLTETLLDESLKELLSEKQYNTARAIIEGYRPAEIARAEQVNKSTISRRIEAIKAVFSSGAYYILTD